MEEYTVTFVHGTSDAVLVHDGDQEMWLPKSTCKCTSRKWELCAKGDVLLVEVPDWLAQQKGLI